MSRNTIRMHSGEGSAVPVHPGDLLPPLFDEATGATELRAAWEAANAEGREAARAHIAARTAARTENPLAKFGDRDAWLKATDYMVRDEAAAVARCTRRSVAALRALDEAHGANYAKAEEMARVLLVEADERARNAMDDLDAAIADRDAAAAVARVSTAGWLTVPGMTGAFGYGTVFRDARTIVEHALVHDGMDVLAAERAAMASPQTRSERIRATRKAASK